MNGNPQIAQRGSGPGGWVVPTAITILFIFAAIFLTDGISKRVSNNALAEQYRKSPGCTSAEPKDSSLPPCANTIVQVIVKKHIEASEATGSRPAGYYLNLSDSQGGRYTTSPSHFLWTKVSVGNELSAQLWRSKITLLRLNGAEYGTRDNPDYEGRLGNAGILIGIGSLVPGLMLLSLRRRSKRPRYSFRDTILTSSNGPEAGISGQAIRLVSAPAYPSPPPVATMPPINQTAQTTTAPTIAGEWQGVYGYLSASMPDTMFEAVFEVDATGMLMGTITDAGRLGTATASGRQAGNQIQFVKVYVKKINKGGGVEYFGEVSPDGQSLSGRWQLTGKLLGFPITTEGYWSAARISELGTPPPADSQFPMQ